MWVFITINMAPRLSSNILILETQITQFQQVFIVWWLPYFVIMHTSNSSFYPTTPPPPSGLCQPPPPHGVDASVYPHFRFWNNLGNPWGISYLFNTHIP